MTKPSQPPTDDTKKAKEPEPSASRLCEMVYEAILKSRAHGMTCDEVEASLRLPHQTASARIYELAGANCIVKAGIRRLTRNSRLAAVWLADVYSMRKV